MTFIEQVSILGKEIDKLVKDSSKDLVAVNKTCSCGQNYKYWDLSECKVNEIGLWKNCKFCDSTMLFMNQETQDKLANMRGEK